MITDYRPWVTAAGNNDTNVYSFPFKITDSSEIVVVQLNTSANPPTIDFVERGDVGLNVQSVDFDSVLGGGTVTFASNLAAGKRIYIKLANDNPTQPSRFREQEDFKLKSIEDALDFIVSQVTRLSDKAERSLRFADPFTHVESTVNLEIQGFPTAYGIPILSSDALNLELKPILTILQDTGVIPDLEDHENRITNLEVASVASFKLSSFQFYAPVGIGAVVTDIYDMNTFAFSKNGFQAICAEFRSPILATSNQKSVTFNWFGTQDNVKWSIFTTLIKPGQAVDDTSYQYTESVEVAITGNKQLMSTTFNISDANGKIGLQNINEGDALLICISRDQAAGTEFDAEAYVISALMKITFI